MFMKLYFSPTFFNSYTSMAIDFCWGQLKEMKQVASELLV